MKIPKKWVSFLTALSILCSMALYSPLGVRAAEVLTLDSPISVSPAAKNEVTAFSFTPQTTGRYGIYVSDPNARLYVALSATRGLYGEPYNGWGVCEIQTELTAGVSYTIQLTGVSGSVSVGVTPLKDLISFDIPDLTDETQGYVDSEVSVSRDVVLTPVHSDVSQIQITNTAPAAVQCDFYGDRLLVSFLAPGEGQVTLSCAQTVFSTATKASALLPLTLGEEQPVSLDPEDTVLGCGAGFLFVPAESGVYTFYSRGSQMTLAMGVGLYDSPRFGAYLDSWDANVLCIRLEAGKKYRVSLMGAGESTFGVVQSAAVEKISPESSTVLGYAGYQGYLSLELAPILADLTALKVVSSDENVVTARITDDVLYYTLRSAGTAVLTVTAGDVQAQIGVTVRPSESLTPGQFEKAPDKAVDAIVYTFCPEAEGEYRIFSETADDVYVAIFDSNRNLVASDDDSGENCNFDVSFTARGAETYYVQIEFWSEPSKTLKFTLKEVPPPPQLIPGEAVEGVLEPYGTAIFTFTAPENGVYGFYTPAQDVALFSLNGEGEVSGYDAYVPSWELSELQVALQAGESCTVQLYNYSGESRTVPVSTTLCTDPEDLDLSTEALFLRSDGTIRTLVLDVLPVHSILPKIEAASSDASLVYVEYYGLWVDIMGLGEGSATVTVTAGGKRWEIPVTVSAALRGDVNGDAVVDGADAMLLRQFVARWKLDTFDRAAADINDDGVIDGSDAMELRRMIAG